LDSYETKAHKFLESPFLKNGFEKGIKIGLTSDSLLSSTYENLSPSILSLVSGDEKWKALEKELSFGSQFHGSDMLGGQVVSDTVRLLAAVFVKHLGLESLLDQLLFTQVLSDKSRKEFINHLKPAWLIAKRFRQWIISERQRYQLEFSELESRVKRGDVLTEAEQSTFATLERRVTYEGICSDVTDKLLLLFASKGLGNKNFSEKILESSSPRLDIAVDLSEMKSLVRINSSDSRRQSLQEYRSVLETWRTLQKFFALKNRMKNQEQPVSLQDSLPDLIISLAQSDCSLADVWNALNSQNERAISRSAACEGLLNLLSLDVPSSLIIETLSLWNNPFREFSIPRSRFSLGHFCRNTDAVLPEFHSALKDSFWSLFRLFLNGKESAEKLLFTRFLLVNACGCEFYPEDEDLLISCKVVEKLSLDFRISESKDMNHDASALLRFSESLLSEHFIASLVPSITADPLTPGALRRQISEIESSGVLRLDLLNAIISEFRRSFDQYFELKVRALKNEMALPEDKISPEDSAFSCEAKCYAQILMLASISGSFFSTKHLSTPQFFSTIFQAFQIGSTRIQEVSLSLLLRLMPLLSPLELDLSSLFKCHDLFLPKQLTRCKHACSDFLSYLFLFCGCSLSLNGTADYGYGAMKFDCRKGPEIRNLGQSVSILLRLLLSSSNWQIVICCRLRGFLESIPSIIETLSNSGDLNASFMVNFYGISAALSLFGGSYERLYPGCRILARSSFEKNSTAEPGSVISLDSSSRTCSVIFDSTPSRISECSFDKLSLNVPSFPSDFDLSSFFPCILTSLNVAMTLHGRAFTEPHGFLYAQLRSSLLRSLSFFLRDQTICKEFSSSPVYSQICSFAIRSVPVEEVESLDRIEESQERCLEIICDVIFASRCSLTLF